MAQTDTTQLIRDLEARPGLIVGLVLVLVAIVIFSPAARAKLDYRLSQLLETLAVAGTVFLCGWGYVATYFV